MQLSSFGKQLTSLSGIGQLMEDLDAALGGERRGDVYFLGGGNPALIPEVSTVFREALQELTSEARSLEQALSVYDAAAGNERFRKTLAEYLSSYFGTNITHKNIALTSGSQNTFFILFNIFAGQMPDGSLRKIFFPMLPDYIGFNDVALQPGATSGCLGQKKETQGMRFVYELDFDCLERAQDMGIMALSQPGNPTGGLLPLEQLTKLSDFAKKRSLPLLLDFAYGQPFPGITFIPQEVPRWEEHLIYSFSLSKLGLPGLRTGIVLASEEVVTLIERVNARMQLAVNGMGAYLGNYLIASEKLKHLSGELLLPWYSRLRAAALSALEENLGNLPGIKMHESHGGFFLWLELEGVGLSAQQLYNELKGENVIVVPGMHYFPEDMRSEATEGKACLRLSFAQGGESIAGGIQRLGTTLKKLMQ